MIPVHRESELAEDAEEHFYLLPPDWKAWVQDAESPLPEEDSQEILCQVLQGLAEDAERWRVGEDC